MSSPAEPQLISPWPAPRVSAPLDADVRVPGSKSLTNRYLVLAALADGPSRLRAPLHSRDTALMIASLRALGAEVREVEGEGAFGPDLEVHPMETGSTSSTEIDCGLAGTVMRFVPPLAALKNGTTAFDGDPHARRRPMSATIDALRGLGVSVHDDAAGALPFSVRGTGEVAGGRLDIDAGASSQFVSALLLAGARFRNGLHLVHVGAALPSREHIAMTVQVLRGAGVHVDDSVPNEWRVAPGRIRAFDVTIEPDLSNAGPFLAAALVAGGTVRMAGWPDSTAQVGDRWRQILPQLGGRVTLSGGTLTVTGTGRIHGAELADTSELAPTVAALCALADSPSVLTGIAHLRGHETDRLAALATEITRLGGDAEETADGLAIRPASLHGGTFETYADHRMATAGALIGLAVPGVLVQDIGTTAKTLPEFPELWQELAASGTSPASPPAGSEPNGGTR
ncbi:3-phosphoshikimate 1-carboxyvinyltransferase [Arthrobacter sp. zg-Y1219]|uniref:3-phosphoshikimate 1-carboxyvinyltransferase n=1 Tax=Arthrobacter sp. zg-Y1219 TaxID=3049067 RepID=UPI0024C2CE4A|nr:3-phosphoshikimate 1-carboxyvinyltransferase [Arthrobacter sp. zg-Y1219]MDK1359483.1 3-phosphoshikimate 1-carboxyvinyltransferase [Arthrobacter sp. zg-Y1219]